MLLAFDLMRFGFGPDPDNRDMSGGDGGRTVPSGAAAFLRVSSPQHLYNPAQREKFRSNQVSHTSRQSTEQRSWRQWYWIFPGPPGHAAWLRNQDQVQGRHADHGPQAPGPGADLAHRRPGLACDTAGRTHVADADRKRETVRRRITVPFKRVVIPLPNRNDFVNLERRSRNGPAPSTPRRCSSSLVRNRMLRRRSFRLARLYGHHTTWRTSNFRARAGRSDTSKSYRRRGSHSRIKG